MCTILADNHIFVETFHHFEKSFKLKMHEIQPCLIYTVTQVNFTTMCTFCWISLRALVACVFSADSRIHLGFGDLHTDFC